MLFEAIGWSVRGGSFLFNGQRLLVMVLQVAIIGLLAIGVTQVILTGGIDLSSGSVVALAAMIAASLAQAPQRARGLSIARRSARRRAGRRGSCDRSALRTGERQLDRVHADSAVHRDARHDGQRARPRALLHARAAREHVDRRLHAARIRAPFPSSFSWSSRRCFTCSFATRVTENTPMPSAPTSRPHACRVCASSGICVLVYTVAGILAGLGGVVTSARAASGQAGMGMSYELDAIAAAVIGGTSLSGGVGRIAVP